MDKFTVPSHLKYYYNHNVFLDMCANLDSPKEQVFEFYINELEKEFRSKWLELTLELSQNNWEK